MDREAEDSAARAWAGLDEAWREAFRQGWEAVRSGNIGVGACASAPDGEIIHSARSVLRATGEGPVLDLAYELQDGGELDRLTALEVDQVVAAVWPRLQVLTAS